jgi:putative ABC transport system substrate-binding protein
VVEAMRQATASLTAASKSVPILKTENGWRRAVVTPGGATGQSRAGASTNFEYSLGGKWLELLKEIAPRVTRVMIIYDPRNVRIFARE